MLEIQFDAKGPFVQVDETTRKYINKTSMDLL
jgi:hypothetical protein